MRIATSQLYSTSVKAMNNQQAQISQLNDQISSGTSLSTAADNPLHAAQAVVMSANAAKLAQYTANQSSALTSLHLEDSTLSSISSTMQSMSTLIVQAGDESLNDSDRSAIAKELASYRSQLLTLSNTTDGAGNYIFSGFQSTTQPFTDVPGSGVQFSGDSGQRLVQVSGTRQMSTSDDGQSVFQSVPALGTQPVPNGSTSNTGSGTVGPVTITDPSVATNSHSYSIKFNATASTYDVNDLTDPTNSTLGVAYTPGSTIQVALGSGMTMNITGTPADNDQFTVTPATAKANSDVFATLDSIISALEAPVSSNTAGLTNLANTLSAAGTAFHNSLANVTMIQASVGGREQELQALQTSTANNSLQAQNNLADLTGLDTVTAITQFEQLQNSLSAAQKAFVQVQGLSLFQYINT